MGDDARGTIASMKASREKRDPVVCFWEETGFFMSGDFLLALLAGEEDGSVLDHQSISVETLPQEQDLLASSTMEAFLVEALSGKSFLVEALSFLVELEASLERAALMVTFDVFRKNPRAAA